MSDIQLKLLDTTMRDGEQTPFVNFSIDEKLHMAKLMDKIGIEMIEAGDPSVSADVYDAIKEISSLWLDAEIVAHSLAHERCLDNAKAVGADRVVVLYPTSDIHLEAKFGQTREEALVSIDAGIRYARSLWMSVRFTPEDATRTDQEYLMQACKVAVEAGADRISIADTLGISQPHLIYDRVHALVQWVPWAEFDLHCHDDFGLALANARAWVRAGANCIHVTVNGLGERTWIPDIAETIMSYQILDGLEQYNISYLQELSEYVEKVTGFFISPNKTIVWQNAYSHKSGVHSSGVIKNPKTYENFDPALVGRERKIIIDKYTGKRAVAAKLDEYKIEYTQEQLGEIVKAIKDAGVQKKIMEETDIIEIAEVVTWVRVDVIPEWIRAIVNIEVESHVYTSSIVRKLEHLEHVDEVMEMSGESDIAAIVSVDNIRILNSFIEQLRSIKWVKGTNTQIVMKRYT